MNYTHGLSLCLLIRSLQELWSMVRAYVEIPIRFNQEGLLDACAWCICMTVACPGHRHSAAQDCR